jgi:metal-responsive CopG/Arc/MetJ family transcriptional regulator
MKIGVSLPDELVTFADETARQRGTTRSGLLAELLRAELIRQQVRHYLDRYGWDIAEDDEAWRRYQRHRTAEEYGDDDW